jgi:hypothetical protein
MTDKTIKTINAFKCQLKEWLAEGREFFSCTQKYIYLKFEYASTIKYRTYIDEIPTKKFFGIAYKWKSVIVDEEVEICIHKSLENRIFTHKEVIKDPELVTELKDFIRDEHIKYLERKRLKEELEKEMDSKILDEIASCK